MKKLSIALLFASVQLAQAYTLSDFDAAAKVATANPTPTNLEKVLVILQDLTKQRNISSGQYQILDRLGLAEYASKNRKTVDLNRFRADRSISRGPGAGTPTTPSVTPGLPGVLPLPPMPDVDEVPEAPELDVKAIDLGAKVFGLESKFNATKSIIDNIKAAGGTTNDVKSRLLNKVDDLGNDIGALRTQIQNESKNTANSAAVRARYSDQLRKVVQLSSDIATLRGNLNRVPVLSAESVAARDAAKDAMGQSLDDLQDALEAAKKIPPMPGVHIPAPIVDDKGTVLPPAPSDDLPDIIVDIKDSKENVDNADVITQAAELFFIDQMIAALDRATLAQEAARAAEAAEKARSEDEKRKARLEEAEVITATFRSYDEELENYARELAEYNIRDADFNKAKANFGNAYLRLITNPLDVNLRESVTQSYVAASQAYATHISSINQIKKNIAEAAQKYNSVVNELRYYTEVLQDLLTQRRYKDLATDPSSRKGRISQRKNELEALKTELNKYQASIQSDSSAAQAVNNLIEQIRGKISEINSFLNNLSEENNIPKPNNLIVGLKNAYNVKYKDSKGFIVEWPRIILGADVSTTPTQPTQPTQPANGNGTKTPEVKTPEALMIEKYSKEIIDSKSADDAINELLEDKYTLTGIDPVKVSALKKVLEQKKALDINPDPVSLNALSSL